MGYQSLKSNCVLAILASSAKTNSVLSASSEQIQMGDKENKTNTLTV